VTTIGGLFGRNALGPIHEHLLKVRLCAHDMKDLVAQLSQGREVASLAAVVRRREEEADRIKDEIRRRVTRSVWGAVERAEVLSLLGKQDDIADGAAQVARLLEVRPTPCPEPLAGALRRWTEGIAHRTDALVKILESARDALESPTGRNLLKDLVRDLGQFQNEEQPTDHLHQDFLERLFALERELDPVTIVVFLDISKAFQTMIGATANAAEALLRLLSLNG